MFKLEIHWLKHEVYLHLIILFFSQSTDYRSNIAISMKKYQLWLQRKTYTQHLHNLLRIKMVSTDRKVNQTKYTLPPEKQKTIRQYSQSSSGAKLRQTLNSSDLQYLVTTRELQKHKLRLVKSKQIVRENQQMAKRINGAKPFINDKRPVDYTNFKLKRKMERANESHSSNVNLKNYQKFMKIHTQHITPNHTHQLTLNIEEIDHRIPPHLYTQLWIQILGQVSIAKSNFIKPSDLKTQAFQFTFPKELPDVFTIQLNSYKGLQHHIIGNYEVVKPEEDKIIRQQWPAVGQLGYLKGMITYKQIKPKFWSVKRFKM